MPFARVGDIRLYYKVDGQGDDLLLIHGVTGYISMWRYVRPHLTGSLRVIMPDLRGHGRSDKPDMRYSVEMFAQDMLGLLDVLGVEQCVVAGHSLGGFIAQQMARQAPERVRGLILICTAHKVGQEAVEAWIEENRAVVGLPPEQALEKRLELAFFDPNRLRSTPGMMELLKENEEQLKINEKSHGHAQIAAGLFNSEEWLEEIRVPTLVIQCGQDKIFPRHVGEHLASHIPGATLRVIDGTSHSIQLEQPKALAQAIVEYCRTLPP